MIMSSRLSYGMAEHGLLPAVLSRVLPQRRTPWVAIVATTAVAMLLTLVGNLSTLTFAAAFGVGDDAPSRGVDAVSGTRGAPRGGRRARHL